MSESVEVASSVIERLVGVLSGDISIEDGRSLVADDVILHLDRWVFEGSGAWETWLRFIRSRRGLRDLRLVDHDITVDPDPDPDPDPDSGECDGVVVRLVGSWAGRRRGDDVTSAPCAATYRVCDGRVVEIWTTRENYVFILGRHLRRTVGWWATAAYARLWAQLRTERRLP